MFTALSVLLAAACLVPAVAKVTSNPRMVASAGHFGIPWSRYRMIGVAEMLAGVGVVAGLFWVPIGIAAASGMVVLLVGALTTHRRSGDGPHEGAPALIVLALAVAYLVAALGR